MSARPLSEILMVELPAAYRLASVILGDPHEAEDATHDAVVIACTHEHQLRDRTRYAAWFQRILVNECRGRLRRRATRPNTVSEMRSDSPDIEERDAIWQALTKLSPDHRVVIVLAYYGDLSTQEIGDRLGLRVGTVKSRLHYALRQLRAEYEASERSLGHV